MKLATAVAWVGALMTTATAALAGVAAPTPAPEVSNGSGDGAVLLVLILGALVIAGGMAAPKDPPGDDG